MIVPGFKYNYSLLLLRNFFLFQLPLLFLVKQLSTSPQMRFKLKLLFSKRYWEQLLKNNFTNLHVRIYVDSFKNID